MIEPRADPPTPTLSLTREPPRALYPGLFVITLSTLLLELSLTRIFSVIMFYHMAFLAVSVTLFGLALGGVIVHFLPRVFVPERTCGWMIVSSLGFAASTVAALLALLAIKFAIYDNRALTKQLVVVSAALAVPFTFSGIAVSLALTRFPRRTNLLYGFDLAGAAAGCLLFPPLIWLLGGPGLILAVAVFGAAAASILAASYAREGRGWVALGLSGGMTAILLGLLLGAPQMQLFKVRYARGYPFDPKFFEFDRWNSISRIVGYSLPEPAGSNGVSKENYERSRIEQKILLIDTFAATQVMGFDGGDFSRIDYPFHDISFPVHAVRKDARVAVIGVGGARDILAAKAWGQPDVVGIEINSRVLEALTEKYHDFAGRPLEWPGVRIVKDEARSYLARSREPFDIIQASLIDTFAATSAGAFVLTENSLYTLEGWKIFLDRLSEDGILTMTRWYTPQAPVESVRLVTLARAALEARGVERPQDHILMARMKDFGEVQQQPLATILVKKSAFTEEEVRNFEQWVAENGFLTLLTPQKVIDGELGRALTTPDLEEYARNYFFDISPPTDDRPFFFDVLRWRDIFKREFRQSNQYIFDINFKPLIMLGVSLLTVTAMAFTFVVVPFLIEGWLRPRQAAETGTLRRCGVVSYFIMLGLGYLLIELSLMQRFTVFLGHPSYSLTVCLFTMLLASGLGSMVAPKLFGAKSWSQSARGLLRLNLSLFAVLLATIVVALWVMSSFATSSTPVRIILAGLTLAPAAFLMGMPFPLALRAAANRPSAPLSWYWGINGAFSVAASVFAVALAHSIGLTGAFLCGAGCYLIAAFCGLSFGSDPNPPSGIEPIAEV